MSSTKRTAFTRLQLRSGSESDWFVLVVWLHIFAAYEKDIGVTDLICSLLSSDHRFCIAVWATSTFGEENIAD